jgi:hypothetical protein
MSKDTLNLPETRTWREIPQQVRPRAMSPEGRVRMTMSVLRLSLGFLVVAGLAWGGWEVASYLREDSGASLDGSKVDRVRNLVLVTDGVLDRTWLARTLALPTGATLMGLDLAQLRARVTADSQVASASLIRNFPDTLTVRLSERSPVARLMARAGADTPRMLLVARDGIAFEGTGYDPAMVATLPWIDGVSMVRAGAGFAPIAGMATVAELLASARLEAEKLYRGWKVISLARLASDGVIEVHSTAVPTVVFGTNENFLRQIARLDLLIDSANDPSRPLRRVDLSLGSQVPVAYGKGNPSLSEPEPPLGAAPATRPLIAFPEFSTLSH